MDAYERRQAEWDQMIADYEAVDQAEYVAFMDEMDARDAEAARARGEGRDV
ncbi:hypothetical protein [Streptomyces liangshanensis]|uniref:hypothetical protein n=1 Tax=Streptomyces liangshanensis TaxID=2717324 RepID=UPI0036D913D9